VRILLNGGACELAEGASVADAVAAAGAGPGRAGIAVALDGEVVPRSEWERTAVAPGQAVEVLEARQGG
jgi:sulfur carrier protein